VDRICPLLGLQGDRRTAIDGVDAGHRCHADDPIIPLDRQQQARVCLTPAHEKCDRYLAHATRNGGVRPGQGEIVGGLVSTRMVIAPDPTWRGIAGRARRVPTAPLVVIGAASIVVGIGGIAVASGAVGDGLETLTGEASTAARSSESPLAQATRTPARAPSDTPTATPSATPMPPSPSPTASPAVSGAPTVAPTVAPPPTQQTYVVQEDDTLAAIAEQFGTSVAALQAANGIDDANEILIGQVLVLP